jgi:transposase
MTERMCPGMERKTYNEDFKKMVVDLYHSGSSVKQLCDEYGVSENAIYKWIKPFSPVQISQDETMTLQEMKQLQKEILRLREENAILKKAMAIFARK